MSAVIWSKLTEPEIAELLSSGMDGLLLPVGATEQHGPHMATGADSIIAEKCCFEVSSLTGVPVLPTLNYGCSLGHSSFWNGTIALDPKVLIDLVSQIGSWIYKHGFKRLFIVNGHVTNYAPLRCALEVLRAEHEHLMVALIDTARISPSIEAQFGDDCCDWHANRAETSVMLHIDKDSIREDLLPSSDDPDRTIDKVFSHPVNRTSKNGVTGYPSQATLTEGESLWKEMVQELTKLVKKGLLEEPPLDQPYHKK